MQSNQWMPAFKQWLDSMGYILVIDRFDSRCLPHYIGIGKAKSGRNHAVVAMDGQEVHDPLPNSDHRIDIRRTWAFLPIRSEKVYLITYIEQGKEYVSHGEGHFTGKTHILPNELLSSFNPKTDELGAYIECSF